MKTKQNKKNHPKWGINVKRCLHPLKIKSHKLDLAPNFAPHFNKARC